MIVDVTENKGVRIVGRQTNVVAVAEEMNRAIARHRAETGHTKYVGIVEYSDDGGKIAPPSGDFAGMLVVFDWDDNPWALTFHDHGYILCQECEAR